MLALRPFATPIVRAICKRAMATTASQTAIRQVDLTTLLTGPAPSSLKKETIDFSKTAVPQYSNAYAVVLDNVLTKDECTDLLAAAEAYGDGKWERAMINIGGGRQAMYTDVRNCGRIIWDDREVVARIWARCEPHMQEIMNLENCTNIIGLRGRDCTWKMTRLNERMRFLKYVGGEYFKTHCDGIYETPDGKERSYYTLHLYLNDETSDEPLIEGGATRFESFSLKQYLDVNPKVGRVLIFQHRDVLHSGSDVVRGTKYTLRTDIMYAKEEK